MSENSWQYDNSISLYRMDHWGEGYFTINSKGHVTALPNQDIDGPQIDFADIIEELYKKGISFPCVIRFHDILRSRVKQINQAFASKIDEFNYKAKYTGVYPIKVNQLREVVEEIVDVGDKYNFGLEAGSKTELLAVLALNENKNALTILNGHKDHDYLKLSLLGRKLGRPCVVVIEKYSELPQYLNMAKELRVEPMIGLRVKLSSRASGKWANSCGDCAKFGLTIPEVIKAINYLKETQNLDCLKLLHFHLGSQITDIRTIKDAITEAARVYAKLVQLGAPIEFFDVGGGLGIDYDGASSKDANSINYKLEDYVSDVVYILKQICDLEEVDHPNIVTEAGRALTAHHSCIVPNITGKISHLKPNMETHKSTGEHILVQNIRELDEDLREDNYLDIYMDALQYKEESISAFKLGVLGLEERGKIETLFWKITQRIVEFAKDEEHLPREIIDAQSNLTEQYLCNLSVFQSVADTWAINQIMPVVPIMGHLEEPTHYCTLADITCDSDGKIDNFATDLQDSSRLPVHHIEDGQEYLIGIFLTGAYQDIMGDMHNLFGRLNEVHIFQDDDDPTDFYIEEVIWGNNSQEVLSMLQYSPQALAQTIKKQLDKQVARGKIRPREGVELTDFYESCLQNYTYLL